MILTADPFSSSRLKSIVECFEDKATQMTNSLKRLQYLMRGYIERDTSQGSKVSPLNNSCQFIVQEYDFLLNLISKIGEDLIMFKSQLCVSFQAIPQQNQIYTLESTKTEQNNISASFIQQQQLAQQARQQMHQQLQQQKFLEQSQQFQTSSQTSHNHQQSQQLVKMLQQQYISQQIFPTDYQSQQIMEQHLRQQQIPTIQQTKVQEKHIPSIPHSSQVFLLQPQQTPSYISSNNEATSFQINYNPMIQINDNLPYQQSEEQWKLGQIQVESKEKSKIKCFRMEGEQNNQENNSIKLELTEMVDKLLGIENEGEQQKIEQTKQLIVEQQQPNENKEIPQSEESVNIKAHVKVERGTMKRSGQLQMKEIEEKKKQNSDSEDAVQSNPKGQGTIQLRQVRKKKYPLELRKKIAKDLKRNQFNYSEVCKKYSISYGTAYYLVTQQQKDLGEDGQNSLSFSNDEQQENESLGENNLIKQVSQDKSKTLKFPIDANKLNEKFSKIKAEKITDYIDSHSKDEMKIKKQIVQMKDKESESKQSVIIQANENNELLDIDQEIEEGTNNSIQSRIHEEDDRNGYSVELKQMLLSQLQSGVNYLELSERFNLPNEEMQFLAKSLQLKNTRHKNDTFINTSSQIKVDGSKNNNQQINPIITQKILQRLICETHNTDVGRQELEMNSQQVQGAQSVVMQGQHIDKENDKEIRNCNNKRILLRSTRKKQSIYSQITTLKRSPSEQKKQTRKQTRNSAAVKNVTYKIIADQA